MFVQCLTTDHEFAALQQDWNCLARGIPFRSWEWLSAWWQHYGAGKELCILAVRDPKGAVVGVAPWFLETRRGGIRSLQFLGSGAVCSDYLSLLTTVEYEEAVVNQVGNWLLTEPGWDVLELEGISRDDQLMQALSQYLKDRGCALHARSTANCWRISLPQQWDAYLKQFPKSKRTKMRGALRRLHDEGQGTLRCLRTPEEIQAAWETLVDLHQRRRESVGDPGCFVCPKFANFLREAALQLAHRGLTQILLLELEGRPVAIDLTFVSDGMRYMYQGGIEPDCLDESPGRMLTLLEIYGDIAQGLTGVDFMRGDEPYKQQWRAQPQPLIDLRVAPPRAWPQLRHRVWVAGETVKDWIREGMTLMGVRSENAAR